jgi:hypothetical protein
VRCGSPSRILLVPILLLLVLAAAGCGSRKSAPSATTAPTSTVALVLQTGALPAPRATAPPSGLSTYGRALWDFEALLHDTFGSRYVCTKGASLNFIAPTNECSPLATYDPYLYQFADARHSAFHLVVRLPKASFGNYPQPVRINGYFVACDPDNRRYLMEFSDASTFTVACTAPLS